MSLPFWIGRLDHKHRIISGIRYSGISYPAPGYRSAADTGLKSQNLPLWFEKEKNEISLSERE